MARAPKVPEAWEEIRRQNRLASKAAAPADQPELAAAPVSKRYEVVGPHEVFGTEPGSVVELALTEGEERALVDAGHLSLADEQEPPAPAVEVEEVAVSAGVATADADQDDLSK